MNDINGMKIEKGHVVAHVNHGAKYKIENAGFDGWLKKHDGLIMIMISEKHQSAFKLTERRASKVFIVIAEHQESLF